jgi:uncharacterized membrane protein YeaQ/YmgE (transglycosylase-associated protein family)
MLLGISIATIVGWVIYGGIVGLIASLISGRRARLGRCILAGIIGAILGEIIVAILLYINFFAVIGVTVTESPLWYLIQSVIGAIIVLGLDYYRD